MNKCFTFVLFFGFFLKTAESASNIEILVDYAGVPLRQVSFSVGLYGRIPENPKEVLITDHRVMITNSHGIYGSQEILLPLRCGEKLEVRALQSGFSTITCTSHSHSTSQQMLITKIMGGAFMVVEKDKKTLAGVVELAFSPHLRITCSPTAISITSARPRGPLARRHTHSELY